MSESKCTAPITSKIYQPNVLTRTPKTDNTFTAQWDDYYKMWVVYPITMRADGTSFDASGQRVI